MPIPAPTVDDRKWLVLVAELLTRIPVYAPEWTEVNQRDPGVTSLGLLAFFGAPGIYVEEIPSRSRPIEGVSTSTGAVISPASCCAARSTEDLRARLRCRAIAVPDEALQDVEKLLGSLRAAIVAPLRTRRRRVAIAIGAVAVAAILAIMFWRPRGDGPGSKGAEDVTSDSVI